MLILWAWSVEAKCCHLLRQETGEGCWKNQGPFLMPWAPFETYLSESTNRCHALGRRLSMNFRLQTVFGWTQTWRLSPVLQGHCIGDTSPLHSKVSPSRCLYSQTRIHDRVKGRNSQLSPWSHVDQCLAQSREGHGNPLQYSCLENPMNRGAWWATVHGV